MLWESNHSTRILWESWFCPFHAKIRNGLDLIFLIIWIKNMGYKINICMRNFIWGYSIGRCQDLPLQSRIIALGSKMHIYWITPIIHYRLHSYQHVVQNTYLKRVLQKTPIEQNQFIQFFLCKETFSTELVSRVSGF